MLHRACLGRDEKVRRAAANGEYGCRLISQRIPACGIYILDAFVESGRGEGVWGGHCDNGRDIRRG
jgi:hypothetical protein